MLTKVHPSPIKWVKQLVYNLLFVVREFPSLGSLIKMILIRSLFERYEIYRTYIILEDFTESLIWFLSRRWVGEDRATRPVQLVSYLRSFNMESPFAIKRNYGQPRVNTRIICLIIIVYGNNKVSYKYSTYQYYTVYRASHVRSSLP